MKQFKVDIEYLAYCYKCKGHVETNPSKRILKEIMEKDGWTIEYKNNVCPYCNGNKKIKDVDGYEYDKLVTELFGDKNIEISEIVNYTKKVENGEISPEQSLKSLVEAGICNKDKSINHIYRNPCFEKDEK